jgi:hypothetical protein
MPFLVPITVQLPLAISAAVVQVPLPATMTVFQIAGSLQALASGTFQVDVRNGAGDLLGSLLWSAAGRQIARFLREIAVDDFLSFDVVSIGIGALGSYVTVWLAVAA